MDQRERQPSDSFAAAALLALAGGFLDAYTYLCRGGVFANAQTGNMVLLGIRAAEGRWAEAASYLAPIGAFALGVLVAEAVKLLHRHPGRFHWRHTVLLAEILALGAAALIPVGEWDSAVNVLVSFVCALQVETFRKVRGYPFASTMCTGNLRSGTDALFHGLTQHDRALLRRAGCYFAVIGCFILGAVLGAVLAPGAPRAAVLIPAAFQLAVFFLMWEHRPAQPKA